MFDEALDDIVIYQNEKGEYAYQFVYNLLPDPLMTMASDKPLQGNVIPITTHTKEKDVDVYSVKISGTQVPENGNEASFLADNVPDETIIRIKIDASGNKALSIYSNVNDDPSNPIDSHDILKRMMENYGPEGTRKPKPDLNGDPSPDGLEDGDKPASQVSVIHERRKL
jgi:hypothetical protein